MKRHSLFLESFFFSLIFAFLLLPSAFAQLPGDKPVTVKVAVVIQDPVLPQFGGKHLHEVVKTPGYKFTWNDPRELSRQYKEALERISHGTVRYEVVETIDDTLLFSNRNDNDQPVGLSEMVRLLTEPGWKTLKGVGTHFDYRRFVEHYGFDKKRDRNEVNEIWVWSFPYGGMYESNYCGKKGFWLNSDPTTTTSNEKLLVVMGLNYERQMSMALESYGHRFESVMWHLYGRWDKDAAHPNNWEKYTQYDKTHPGRANIGNIHFPPNGVHDYDWVNKTPVTTCADGWNYYPDIREEMTRTIDCTEWQCNHEGYMTFWFSHLPHFAGINPADGHLNNWWRYVVNWEDALALEKKELETLRKKFPTGVPTVGFIEGSKDSEQMAALGYLQGQEHFRFREVGEGEVGTVKPAECAVLWYHKPDTLLTATDTSKQVIGALRKYVEKGGNLFLSLDAVRLLPYLGVETVAPTVNYVELKDEGNGRKLGLHGFRSHPVFDGLLGGVYSYAPKEDVSVRRVGWFGDAVPSGKVVAVDWAYIFIHEGSKLVTEYNLGKGKILAAGAYLYYGQPNYNRVHLEKFTANVLNYLSGGDWFSRLRYWDFNPGYVKEQPFASAAIATGKPVRWETVRSPIALQNPKGAGNMWDIAGERMVIMGKESGGIDEIWAHPYMALRDYRVSVQFADGRTPVRLNDQNPVVEVSPESFTRTYPLGGDTLREIVVCHPTDGNAVIHYEWTGSSPVDLLIRFKSNLRFMWPYSERVTGALEYGWDKELNACVIQDKSGDFVTILGADSEVKARDVKPGEGLLVDAGMTVSIGPDQALDVVLGVSATGRTEAESAYRRAMLDPRKVYEASVANSRSLFDGKLSISGPDTDFNTGYKWAVVGTDRFIVNTPGVGRSLVAGYATTAYGWNGAQKVSGRPGYAWYFGRDAVWSSFAVLDYGDFDRVKTVLQLFSRYQDISGKIYHELTTSGIAHYDAADATPLYIALAGKYLHHSGDTALIRREWPAIKKAIDFCFSTDTDGDHLIENTQQGHGWEEGGDLYGTHTTQYMVSCWGEALNQAAYIAKSIGLDDLAEKYGDEAVIVLSKLNNDFWNPSTGFFNHGLYKDGTYLTEPSVMTAVPVYWRQIEDPAKAQSVVEKMASCNFTTDWGTRIVSEKAKFFAPGGYHTGSVWPLFTGWASLADYATGNPAQGFSKMMSNLLIYKFWSLGYIEEVLHGTQFKYFGVCRHQAWSETMVLQPAIEGMLGFQPDALANRVSVTPAFPPDWDSVTVDNLRVGNQVFKMTQKRTPGHILLDLTPVKPYDAGSGESPLTVMVTLVTPPGGTPVSLTQNGDKTLYANDYQKTKGSRIPVKVYGTATMDRPVHFDYAFDRGLEVLPRVYHPQPGDSSTGLKIIAEKAANGKYAVTAEGLSGKTGEIRVEKEGKTEAKTFTFPESGEKYTQKDVVFYNDKPDGEVIYYLLVRSFYDSNGDGIGDLNGLREKLDYLQELGVTSILTIPLNQSDFYHNYYSTDYERIDPEYGTEEDLVSLIREIHRRGMKFYLDMETQYVTEGSEWFSNRPDYQVKGTPWSRLKSYTGEVKSNEMANLYNPEVSDYFHRLYVHFLDPNGDGRFEDGVDGFRIDHLMDNLDNTGKLTNLYAGFWKPLFEDLRKVHPDIRIIGEQGNWLTYGEKEFKQAGVDYLFDFQVAGAISSFNKGQLISKMDSSELLTPGICDQLIFIENHDLDRFASLMNGNLAKEKVGAALNLLLKGIPLIYYGQELGMKGAKYNGDSDGNDIPRREAFEWYRSGQGKGMAYWYKDSGPWWTHRYARPNDGVSLQEEVSDPSSLWNLYRSLIALRKQYPALAGGELTFIPNDNPQVLTFSRQLDGQTVNVAINLSSASQTATGSSITPPADGRKALLNVPSGNTLDKGIIRLKPWGILVAETK